MVAAKAIRLPHFHRRLQLGADLAVNCPLLEYQVSEIDRSALLATEPWVSFNFLILHHFFFLGLIPISIFHAALPKISISRIDTATHPDNVEEEVARSGVTAGTTAKTKEESLVSVFVLVRLGLIQWRQLLRRIITRHFVSELHSHFVVLRLRTDLVHSILRFRVHVL